MKMFYLKTTFFTADATFLANVLLAYMFEDFFLHFFFSIFKLIFHADTLQTSHTIIGILNGPKHNYMI